MIRLLAGTFGLRHHPGADTAQNINLLALQPGSTKQIAKPWHQTLWLRRVKKADGDQRRFEMPIEPLHLFMGREKRSPVRARMPGCRIHTDRRCRSTNLQCCAAHGPGEHLNRLRQVERITTGRGWNRGEMAAHLCLRDRQTNTFGPKDQSHRLG